MLAQQAKKATKKRDCMGIFKGQGATEYLVLLAVVLIVALVSVALLGFFPGMASDARITQSQAYWRGQAKPFAILDASIAAGGIGTFSIQNMEANSNQMTALYLGGCSNTTAITFGAGEIKTLTAGAICGTGSAGGIYDYNVTINYTTASNVVSKQYGTKNLIGKFI